MARLPVSDDKHGEVVRVVCSPAQPGFLPAEPVTIGRTRRQEPVPFGAVPAAHVPPAADDLDAVGVGGDDGWVDRPPRFVSDDGS